MPESIKFILPVTSGNLLWQIKLTRFSFFVFSYNFITPTPIPFFLSRKNKRINEVLKYFNQKAKASKLSLKKVFRNKRLCRNRCLAFWEPFTYLYLFIILHSLDWRFLFVGRSFEHDSQVYLFRVEVIINCCNLLLTYPRKMVSQRNYLIA